MEGDLRDMRLSDGSGLNLTKEASNQDVLDYILLTVIERLGQDNLAFKGGYMLNQLLPEVSRQTQDIDFSIANGEQYEEVKTILMDIGEYLISKGLIHSYKIKENISPTSSGGVDFYNEMNQKVLGVDVGWHQLSLGTRWYDLSLGRIHAFSVERMLSDKIHAIFTPKRFRRTKDLYDVYYLLENFDVDYGKFKECIQARGEIDLSKNPFREDVLVQYVHAWDKLNVVSRIPSVNLKKPEFKPVIERLGVFCFPVMVKFECEHSIWNHNKCEWE